MYYSQKFLLNKIPIYRGSFNIIGTLQNKQIIAIVWNKLPQFVCHGSERSANDVYTKIFPPNLLSKQQMSSIGLFLQ